MIQSNRDVFTTDLKLTWNVLDFGLSYIRAQQAGDEVLIAEEEKRKIVNRIVQDVRAAYWRAVTNDRLILKVEQLLERVSKAIEESKQVEIKRLEYEIDITYQEIEILRIQAKRIAASAEELSNIQIIIKQLQESRSKLDGLNGKKNQLVLRAPINGVIYDLEESLHYNRWINQTLPIATIVEPVEPTIESVLPESDLSGINVHATAKFIPDNPELNSVWGYVKEIEHANLQVLDMPTLASIYGGKVPAQFDEFQKIVPDKSVLCCGRKDAQEQRCS
ncbi:MAG: TolC family protein [Proteobacteria bacterium]|nr:TolC family protein [Pseudomonadota bacterium]